MSISSAMTWVASRAGKGIRCKAARAKMPIAITTAPEAVGKVRLCDSSFFCLPPPARAPAWSPGCRLHGLELAVAIPGRGLPGLHDTPTQQGATHERGRRGGVAQARAPRDQTGYLKSGRGHQ